MYAKIEEKIHKKYWDIKLLNFLKLKNNNKKFKIQNFTKMKKCLVIFTQGIFTPILKKIRT